MFEKTKRIGALLLVVVMIFSLAACKKSNDDTSSDYIEYVTEVEYVTEDGETVDGGNDTTSKKEGSGKDSSTGKDTSKDSNSLKGTTVRYAIWADYDKSVVSKFEKKTGIKVKIDSVSQGDYTNTVASKIASASKDNPGPDVFFCNNFFPWCLEALQPIDAMKLDLSDPIWDKGIIDYSTINGKSYFVNTVGNFWTEVDCLYFNKNVLKQAGVPESMYPDKQAEAGTWTWDALGLIMKQVKEQLGEGYYGAYLDYGAMVASAGCEDPVFKNGKFVNGLNSHTIDVNVKLAEWYTAGYVKGFSPTYRDDFIAGKTAIAVTHAYGLKANGYWKKMNSDQIGFTYIPDFSSTVKAKTAGMLRGWGLCKGASNPEGAGAFLRYYLDVNNYNTSSLFLNSAAETFFFKLTSGVKTTDKVLHQDEPGVYAQCTPDQVAGQVTAAMSNTYADWNEIIAKKAN